MHSLPGGPTKHLLGITMQTSRTQAIYPHNIIAIQQTSHDTINLRCGGTSEHFTKNHVTADTCITTIALILIAFFNQYSVVRWRQTLSASMGTPNIVEVVSGNIGTQLTKLIKTDCLARSAGTRYEIQHESSLRTKMKPSNASLPLRRAISIRAGGGNYLRSTLSGRQLQGF